MDLVMDEKNIHIDIDIPLYKAMSDIERSVCRMAAFVRERPEISNSNQFNALPVSSKEADLIMKEYMDRR